MILKKEVFHQNFIKHWKVNDEKYSSFTKIEQHQPNTFMHVTINNCKYATNTSNNFDGYANYPNHSVVQMIVFLKKYVLAFAFKRYVSIWVPKEINKRNGKNKYILIVITNRQKNKLGSCGQGTKRILKNIVSYLECQSKCPCLQAVKSCSNSSGCIGCENLFSKNQGEDSPLPVQ